MAANVPKHGKFVWRIGGKEMENTNDVQDTSEDGETVLEQTININLQETDALQIITSYNDKELSCR